MGACMQHPNFAIVTSLCKGNTLYTHIHLRKDKFNMNKTTLIAQQISQVNLSDGEVYFHRLFQMKLKINYFHRVWDIYMQEE